MQSHADGYISAILRWFSDLAQEDLRCATSGRLGKDVGSTAAAQRNLLMDRIDLANVRVIARVPGCLRRQEAFMKPAIRVRFVPMLKLQSLKSVGCGRSVESHDGEF